MSSASRVADERPPGAPRAALPRRKRACAGPTRGQRLECWPCWNRAEVRDPRRKAARPHAGSKQAHPEHRPRDAGAGSHARRPEGAPQARARCRVARGRRRAAAAPHAGGSHARGSHGASPRAAGSHGGGAHGDRHTAAARVRVRPEATSAGVTCPPPSAAMPPRGRFTTSTPRSATERGPAPRPALRSAATRRPTAARTAPRRPRAPRPAPRCTARPHAPAAPRHAAPPPREHGSRGGPPPAPAAPRAPLAPAEPRRHDVPTGGGTFADLG